MVSVLVQLERRIGSVKIANINRAADGIVP